MNATNLAVEYDRNPRREPQSFLNQQRDAVDGYAQTLRVIGQQLEPIKPQAFDVVRYDRCYLARGLTKQTEKHIRLLPRFLRIPKHEYPRPGKPGGRLSRDFELLYTLKDIRLLEEQGKARRRDPRGMPEPFNLANILRAVGWFLDDQSGARLILATYHGVPINFVNIIYETPQGVRRLEEYATSVIYDCWVKWYLMKKQRLRPTREL